MNVSNNSSNNVVDEDNPDNAGKLNIEIESENYEDQQKQENFNNVETSDKQGLSKKLYANLAIDSAVIKTIGSCNSDTDNSTNNVECSTNSKGSESCASLKMDDDVIVNDDTANSPGAYPFEASAQNIEGIGSHVNIEEGHSPAPSSIECSVDIQKTMDAIENNEMVCLPALTSVEIPTINVGLINKNASPDSISITITDPNHGLITNNEHSITTIHLDSPTATRPSQCIEITETVFNNDSNINAIDNPNPDNPAIDNDSPTIEASPEATADASTEPNTPAIPVDNSNATHTSNTVDNDTTTDSPAIVMPTGQKYLSYYLMYITQYIAPFVAMALHMIFHIMLGHKYLTDGHQFWGLSTLLLPILPPALFAIHLVLELVTLLPRILINKGLNNEEKERLKNFILAIWFTMPGVNIW